MKSGGGEMPAFRCIAGGTMAARIIFSETHSDQIRQL
jgi:hypothetical protein